MESDSLVLLFKRSACYKQMSALVKEYTGAGIDDARNVQCSDLLLQTLAEHSELKQNVKLHVKSVGVMPSNRKGEGLNPNKKHETAH